MSFVDDEDVQIHLPVDKLQVEEVPDDLAKAEEDSERVIRGYLAAVFEPATLAGWTTPANTPEQIRAVSGRLTAALLYRLRYSEDSLDDPQFAQIKYNEAMAMLQAIIDGEIILTGVTDTSTVIDNTWFEPNDASTEAPKFTMSDVY